MLHPSDTDRLEQLEKEFSDLKTKYLRLLDYLGLDEDIKERPTLPAPPPGSDPPLKDPWEHLAPDPWMKASWTSEEQVLLDNTDKLPSKTW